MTNMYDPNIDSELLEALSDEDELTEESFEELSNGKGDDDDE